MLPQLSAKLSQVRATRNFNPASWISAKVDLLNSYLSRSGLSGIVVNVSGGVDSALSIALAHRASQVPGSPLKRVVGILQPIHSTASIQDRGENLCKALGIQCIRVDQTAVYDLLSPIVESVLGISDPPAFARGQLRSYMRTPVAYYVCQLLSVSGNPVVVL